MISDDEPRPRIVPPPTRAHRALDLLSLVGAAGSVAAGLWTWGRLPARIPTHFGASGAPDAWGARSTFVLLLVMPPLLHVVLSLLARHPRAFNYPVAITAANAEGQYRLARTFLAALKALLVWTIGLLMWRAGLVGRGEAAGIGAWFVPAVVVLPLALVIGYVAVAHVRSGHDA